MRALFFGSPEFAVPCLDALHEIAEVAAVVCQPDRPAGRGLSLRAPAVKVRALGLGLSVLQPTKVRTAAFADQLVSLEADVGVVVAYGRILPLAVLDAPRFRCVNIHASLLPRWRGAAPIQWAIAEGDTETGVTLMQMDEGMDTGPMLARVATPIEQEETGATLTARLSQLGAEVLRAQLPVYVAGDLTPVPQDHLSATAASLLKKTDGAVDWQADALRVHNLVRAMTPWPGAYTHHNGRRLKLFSTLPKTVNAPGARPGQVIAVDAEGVLVACGKGAVVIRGLQENGRKRLTAQQVVAGKQVAVGDRWLTEAIKA